MYDKIIKKLTSPAQLQLLPVCSVNLGGGEIFRTRPDRPWGPSNLLYNGYRVCPAGKKPRRGIDYPPHLALRLKIK
jgi:hypothetical protein